MLLASSGGVLAESSDGEPDRYPVRYTFESRLPVVELTQGAPKHTIHVVLGSESPEDGGIASREILLEVEGTLTTTIEEDFQPVEVSLTESFLEPPAPERVYQTFAFAEEVGWCAGVCKADLDFVFNRTDSGKSVGKVTIEWSIKLSVDGTTNQSGAPDSQALPWTVETSQS